MDTNVIEGQWKQVKGQIKQQWGKLTDDDLDRAEGHWDELIGIIQEKYGETKQDIEAALERLVNDLKQNVKDI